MRLFHLLDDENPLVGLRVSHDFEIACLISWNDFEVSQPVVGVNKVHVKGFEPHHFLIDDVLLHGALVLQIPTFASEKLATHSCLLVRGRFF